MLYLMRHGLTSWNKIHKLQGRSDVPLNDEGREMAMNAHDEYNDVHFDVCFCSPLIRAKETANLVLKDRNVPIVYESRLQEMCFGIYEGYLLDVSNLQNEVMDKVFVHPEKYIEPFEGAESFDDVINRVGSFIEEVVNPLLEENKDVLLIAHGAVNAAINSYINKIPRSEYWCFGREQCKLIRVK